MGRRDAPVNVSTTGILPGEGVRRCFRDRLETHRTTGILPVEASRTVDIGGEGDRLEAHWNGRDRLEAYCTLSLLLLGRILDDGNEQIGGGPFQGVLELGNGKIGPFVDGQALRDK